MNEELIHLARDVNEMKPLMTESLLPPLNVYKQAYLFTQWSVVQTASDRTVNGNVGATKQEGHMRVM